MRKLLLKPGFFHTVKIVDGVPSLSISNHILLAGILPSSQMTASIIPDVPDPLCAASDPAIAPTTTGKRVVLAICLVLGATGASVAESVGKAGILCRLQCTFFHDVY